MQRIQFSDGTGILERYATFPSRHVAPRHVDVWCPPDYAISDQRYPVIYMHDGQNLFDPATSKINVDWGIDEAIARLMVEEKTSGAIVVGIWHPPQRWCEYMPQKLFALPSARAWLPRFIEQAGGEPVSDRYLEFLVHELKPHIDARYRTIPDPAHTFTMGSSMGGLISLYALVEYPQVFGGAGCLSTHWTVGGNDLVDYLGSRLPKPGVHQLYFDYGTATLDTGYEPFQLRMDGWLAEAGYTRGHDWLSLKFAGAEHSERAWRARVHIPLAFLLG